MHRNSIPVIHDLHLQVARAPLATDDASKGLFAGCRWIDTSATPKVEYVCIANTPGAATWLASGGASAADLATATTAAAASASAAAASAAAAALSATPAITGTVTTSDATQTNCGTYTPAHNTLTEVKVTYVGRKSDGSDALVKEHAASFLTDGSGVVTQVSTTTAGTSHVTAGATSGSWAVTTDTDGTVVRFRVTGQAATTIHWAVAGSVVSVS